MDIIDKLERYAGDVCLSTPVEIEAAKEIKRLRIGFERYETARCMTPDQWKAAWQLNIRTGKPFDEIIDDLKVFR